MTTEEEIIYLKGRVDALAQLCSILIATHQEGDNLALVFKNRASIELHQPDSAPNEQLYARGYASVVADVELGQTTVKSAKIMRAPDTGVTQ